MDDLTKTCGASTTAIGLTGSLGPCVLRANHDGSLHKAPDGTTWHPATRADTAETELETVRERLAEESAGLAVAWQAAKDWKARAEQAEAERDALKAATDRVRALAERMAALAPADDWGDTIGDTAVADAARTFLAALDQPTDTTGESDDHV